MPFNVTNWLAKQKAPNPSASLELCPASCSFGSGFGRGREVSAIAYGMIASCLRNLSMADAKAAFFMFVT